MDILQTELSGESLAKFLGDSVVETIGNPQTIATTMSPAIPGKKGALSFIGAKLFRTIVSGSKTTASSLVLLPPDDHIEVLAHPDRLLLVVENPRLQFSKAASHFFLPTDTPHIHPTASIDPSSKVGQGVSIGAFAVVSRNVVISDFAQIGSGTFLGAGVQVGQSSTIGANCSIGQSGFGYERDEAGIPQQMPHFGTVRIGNHVDFLDRQRFQECSASVQDHSRALVPGIIPPGRVKHSECL